MRQRIIFNIIKQRGQVLVLFALCIPIMLLFVGLALDIGWYYLNVSRLQNAADAAALAGAKSLVQKRDTPFADYFVSQLSENRLPDDFENYADAYSHKFGTLTKYYSVKDDEDVKLKLIAGRDTVEEYMRKNLSTADTITENATNWQIAHTTDFWSLHDKESDKTVSGEIELKYKVIDAKNDVRGLAVLRRHTAGKHSSFLFVRLV